MIDQREVRHLIRQNKKIKEKIAEQARVYKEEKQKLKYINRSLQKTLEDEKQKNQATIEEFNAQIIALEAELRRVKSNEPAVTSYTTPNSRPIKQISFAQLEAESRRLAEETNRIIQQNQIPNSSLFAQSTLNTSNNPYQSSKFSNIQNYRTRYQFNIPDNYQNSNGFNLSSQQQQQTQKQQIKHRYPQQQLQQHPPQQQFQQQYLQQQSQQQELQQQQQYNQQQFQQQQQQFQQYNYSKTQPPIAAQNNKTQHQENQNANQINQEIPQKNSTAPNHQINSNTLPISNNQQSADLLDQIVEEEEENTDSDHNEQKIDASSNSLTDDTIPAGENPTETIENFTNDNTNIEDKKNQTQSQQAISQNPSKSSSSSINQSSSKASFNTPKPSPQKPIPAKKQNEAPSSSQSQNVASNNEKSQQQNKINQKAATSPGMAVIINDDTQNADDPFADNFLNEEEFPEEASKQSEQQDIKPKQQETAPPKQEVVKQEKQNSPQPKKSPKKDPFMNDNLSGMFDDISFNQDASGFELDMEAAFEAASQSKSLDKKDYNNTKAKNNDNNKDKKPSGKQNNKKNDKQDDPDDLNVPSAGSWSFPSSQIHIEGFED